MFSLLSNLAAARKGVMANICEEQSFVDLEVFPVPLARKRVDFLDVVNIENNTIGTTTESAYEAIVSGKKIKTKLQ